ncbi:MAG: LytR C-terminal domain-containing protein [Bifidobacterium sp.]|jgi:hypothetical protein|nr:LytR C-terminal domain-containing protein [Bifidobacterium sp.]MCI1865687.1 LytR C-terminal domain-containing protein [Bifidobacterium sp.]
MTQPMDEREARRRYVRRRQSIVFSIVAAVMAVTLLVCSLIFFHRIGASKETAQTVQPNYGVAAVCAPKDQDGNPSKYVDNSTVKIRVLNGTKFPGLARAVGEALAYRKFTLTAMSNYTSENVQRTTIYFGKNAIAQAYTLNSNFTDAILQMDDRQDKLVDVVVGATFNDLKDKKDVPGSGAKISNIEGCHAADTMKSLPHAITHDSAN